jgi:hypothetical protein
MILVPGVPGETLAFAVDELVCDRWSVQDGFGLHQLGWSRRTINRRLAQIRETLGVATTAEALVLARSARSA